MATPTRRQTYSGDVTPLTDQSPLVIARLRELCGFGRGSEAGADAECAGTSSNMSQKGTVKPRLRQDVTFQICPETANWQLLDPLLQ